MGRAMRVAGTLLLAGCLARAVVAQEIGDQTSTRIRGTVHDLETGTPLMGAFVAPQGLTTGFLTDSLGRFVLELPPAPTLYLSAERLGYETTRLQVGAHDSDRPLKIMLRPDPVLLEGVEVLVDRWDRRRRFHPGSIRVFDQTALLRAGVTDALSFVRSRAATRVRICPQDPFSFCAWRRGRWYRMRVCLDEMPLFDGGRTLETMQPQDFFMIEVFDQGREVRLYTERFVEQAARRRSPVRPLVMGC